MSITVQDLMQSALRLLGATRNGRTPAAQVLADGLVSLNQMVDAWGTEKLTFYTSARTVFNVLAGQQVYTIGPSGADWTAPRPLYLDRAGVLIAGGTATERPLDLLRSAAAWAAIRVKGVSSTIPTALYYESDYPNGTMALWPSPSAASQVALYTPSAVSQFTSLAQTISLPPGYEKALRYGLAVELAPEIGANLNPLLVEQAEAAKASLKRANFSIEPLRCDAALVRVGRRAGAFDVLTGEGR